MKNNNRCKICGSDNTKVIVGKEEYQYKGKVIIIDNFKKIICNNCHEEVADPESVKKSIPTLRDAQRTIDGFLTSREIKSTRKSFNMTQDEFGDLLGGGEKAFARYETGRVMQSKPMDNLLKILRKYPEALAYLKGNEMCKSNPIKIENKTEPYNPEEQQCPFEYVFSGNNVIGIQHE